MSDIQIPEQLPGLDCTGGLDRASDDLNFYLALWDQYDTRYHDAYIKVADLFNQGDLENLSIYTHALKGVCATLGATGIQETAFVMEQLSVIPDDAGSALLHQLKEEQQTLAESLSVLRNIAAGKEPA